MKNKDIANTWEQRDWAFAVEFHARYKAMLNSTNPTIAEYCKTRVAQFEAKYPQLKQG